MEIREVKITGILNPTSIDLGEYVINPYRGCEFACLYCYVRHNKVTLKDKRVWGEYIDIRTNAPLLLEKELALKKPHRVLLGSTTECFQPVEKEWQITKKVIEILNKYKVFYTILTRSPLILEALPLLKEGFCEAIYFTINQFDESLKRLLEPKSPSFDQRIKTIEILLEEDIPVIPYFSPILPHISDLSEIFCRFKKAKVIDFEGLNFNLGSIKQVIESIGILYPRYQTLYQAMARDKKIYDDHFGLMKKEIIKQAILTKRNHHIFIHAPCAYFENTYR